jgi:hypothetical protein
MQILSPKEYLKQFIAESGFKNQKEMIKYYQDKDILDELLLDVMSCYKNNVIQDIKDELIKL